MNLSPNPTAAELAKISHLTIVPGEPEPDGELVTVVHEDGFTEDVIVRVIPRSEFADYAAAIASVADLPELNLYVPGKSVIWWCSLEPASVQPILDAGIRLNLVLFNRWLARKARDSKLAFPPANLLPYLSHTAAIQNC